MYVQLAPIRLKNGIDERMLLEASDLFEASFVKNQTGIMKRMLLKGMYGGYADLVFFESKADADRLAKIEESSAECLEFFKLMELPDSTLGDMGVLSFQHVKTYD